MNDDRADGERFRALARAAREIVFIHEGGVIREINDAFTRVLGYERDDIIGRSGLEVFIMPESRAAVVDSMRRERGGTREILVRGKSGEHRIVQSVSEPIQYQGRPMRVVTMQDLTDFLALEAENRRIAGLLAAIVDNTSQLVFVKDLDGKILLTNAAWRVQFGEPGPASVRDADMLPPHLMADIREGDRRVLAGEPSVTFEQTVVDAVGTRTFLTTKFALNDERGKAYAIGGISTDITQRKRSTELMSLVSRDTLGSIGQAFFEAMVKSLARGLGASMVFIGELDDERRRVRALAACSGDELVPSFEYDLRGAPCEHVAASATTCIHPERVQELFPEDVMLVRRGVQGYIGVPVTGSDGRAQGLIVALFDRAFAADAEHFASVRVTLELFAARAAAELERARATRMLEKIREALERRVSERTAELTAMNEELEAFAYTVSHDLRAPLRHIAGFAELLDRSARAGMSPEGQRHLDTIRRSAHRMSTLIDDLLSFSRTGRSTMNPSRFATRALVEQIVREHDGAAVEWQLGALPEVEGDRPMLTQVLRNLVENAVKYSRGRTPARIAITADESADEHTFHVRDNGVGFDPRYADQLFGVFRRLHRSDEFEGNGIGLASVRRIVARHGGRAWADGRPGEGATFSFTLPKRRPT